MSTPESRMRQRIVKILKPLHAVSVENSCGAGTPDVNHLFGWLECKQIDKPKTAQDVIKIPHFTPQQRLFLRQREGQGGLAEVCLKIGRDWFIIGGVEAADHLGIDWTYEDLMQKSRAAWYDMLDEEKFLGFFTRSKYWIPEK